MQEQPGSGQNTFAFRLLSSARGLVLSARTCPVKQPLHKECLAVQHTEASIRTLPLHLPHSTILHFAFGFGGGFGGGFGRGFGGGFSDIISGVGSIRGILRQVHWL